jgi:hypothetical protein
MAYLLLEEARLRLERILTRSDATAVRQRRLKLHRELGLAGFVASASIPRGRRLAAAARAHEWCFRDTAVEQNGEPMLLTLVGQALRAVEDGLAVPTLSDQMHLTHVHLLNAQELLATVDVYDKPPAVEVVRAPPGQPQS